MSVLMVPPRDEVAYPSMGPQVCDWIKDNLCHGPGDILGEEPRMDDETRAIIRRAYEVYPRGHAQEGRRRFRNVCFSRRKGTAKTEHAAWIVIAELHPDAPVRFNGWGRVANVEGGVEPAPGTGVSDPYIPLLATTEEQSEALTYDAVRAIVTRSAVAGDFEAHQSRIIRIDGRGYAEAVTGSPDARDGARTTFQVFDELHRLVALKLRQAYQVMQQNIPKRLKADAWSLATTTAFMPGQGSVAEEMKQHAELIDEGKVRDPSLFYFHRQADDGHDLTDEDEVKAAIEEASGQAVLKWSNLEGILSLWRDPLTDRSYFERVWLNRSVMSDSQVFDLNLIRKGIRPRGRPQKREDIVLGFDGSRTNDATFLVGTVLHSGYQFVLGSWERPPGLPQDWEVPGDEVNQVFEEAMRMYKVRLALCDRAFWETHVDTWAGKWPKVAVVFPTSALRKTSEAIKDYVNSWKMGEVSFDGDPLLLTHFGNTRKRELTLVDTEGVPLYLMEKEPAQPEKRIDGAYAAMLSWTARALAIKDGALQRAGSKAGRTTVYI